MGRRHTKRREWPQGKEFAFTVIDDTDNACLANVRPVYDLLEELGFRTTKTVWVYPPRRGNLYRGSSLQDAEYRSWILELQRSGFEIALHNVGSGVFTRRQILDGLNQYISIIGNPPQMQINHSSNPDNIYWGSKRFGFPVNLLHCAVSSARFYGEDPDSPFFWGDACRDSIKYIRSHVFNEINTLRADPYMPYCFKRRPFSGFWFSSSDGRDVERFNRLLDPKNVKRLFGEQGACIVYTHFASGFVKDGKVDSRTQLTLESIARLPGWYVPASELLDWLLERKYFSKNYELAWRQQMGLDVRWLMKRARDSSSMRRKRARSSESS